MSFSVVLSKFLIVFLIIRLSSTNFTWFYLVSFLNILTHLLLGLNIKRTFLKAQNCEKLEDTTHRVFERNSLPYLGFSLEVKRNEQSVTEERVSKKIFACIIILSDCRKAKIFKFSAVFWLIS